jgi:uncharacterized protein YqeY
MAALKERIAADVVEAMKARDRLRADALRSALSAFSYKRAETGKDLTDEQELEVLRKQVKQRDDAIMEFRKAGREELAEKEAREREILAAYLPPQKSPDEIRAIVREVLATLEPGARSQGAVMKAVMPRLRGEADGATVREIVLEELRA